LVATSRVSPSIPMASRTLAKYKNCIINPYA
jgi:hypothetical protein